MSYHIDTYLKHLDSIITECGPVPCLVPKSNAVTRRATTTYWQERKALENLVRTQNLKEVSEEIYDKIWPVLARSMKYGVLCYEYALPRRSTSDSRWPQDGRLVPGFAKNALSQLRTLTKCVLAECGTGKEQDAA